MQIEVAHPLQQVLQMRLIGLEHSCHNRALLQQVVETRHVHRVQEIDLEVVRVPDVIAEERYPFGKTNVRDECRLLRIIVVRITAIRECQGMVNGVSEGAYVLIDIILFQRLRVGNVEVREGAMNVSADFLAGLGGAKDTNYRDMGKVATLSRGAE